MSKNDPKKAWESYCVNECATLVPLLTKLGFVLDTDQPHLIGERHLMQALTTVSGKKLILLGRRVQDGLRVVIKAASNAKGKAELRHDRACRLALERIRFSYQTFFSPREILFTQTRGFIISIQEFIPKDIPFIDRPLQEQFMLALASFKAQESAHAATHKHHRLIRKNFGDRDAAEYLRSFDSFIRITSLMVPHEKNLVSLLEQARRTLETNTYTIDQYGNFLTHTDFVPHNFRIKDGIVYLLDHASIRFGNKYEGWARFLNFMTLYNRPLEEALVRYVADNRTPEELLCLRLMRIYRLGEIIAFYASSLPQTSDNQHELQRRRVLFWGEVLRGTLNEQPLDEKIRTEYIAARDRLRSEDEVKRQQGLH